ncbi:hypothetical protein ETAA8_39780 [Anatilimnocola aggregata]|uniref:Uncharacterized protein n=1 Tax=Anatilimnocola aggregata TaxID=2528021 RepID=A0A517YFE9_9BACT|nr:hypothetical protein ETAA8_39780 [Anatilimnocola aggregata]
MGELDNTLIIYIVGDIGTSPERQDQQADRQTWSVAVSAEGSEGRSRESRPGQRLVRGRVLGQMRLPR